MRVRKIGRYEGTVKLPKLPATLHVCIPTTMTRDKDLFVPIVNVVVCDGLGLDLPWT